ncbi:stage III sporulation protein AF [Bacillus sp. T33-2]|uniref:stage III sporulation protein AF n=1 Tax=Bacillus sp. T33-2 TaxID=2054168 RepID=UPI000C775908|nr:stage III sporulation protein AF [Bacillus sp. T33-2]PLR99885.1 stage III sporulation protein AF [Bacillus sp. T33-2]
MDVLKEWITNIILFILLATVIDMLLPNSNLQKYTKIVTGLLLIAIILSPVLKLLSGDFERALASIPLMQDNGGNNMENLIEMQKTEIQASQHAYILEQMAVQLKKDAEEELMERYGMEIDGIELVENDNKDQRPFPENLESIIVSLKVPEDQEAIEAVKTVEINTDQPLPSKQQATDTNQIVYLLSEKWNVPAESIQVVIEGGHKQNG